MATNQNNDTDFSGTFFHAVDDKHRVTIPSDLRNEISEFFVVPNARLGCLTVMPREVFRMVGEEAAELCSKEEHRSFMRRFYGKAHRVTIDKQGRLLLPVEQCKLLDLRDDAVLSGARDRFQIWSPARWKKHEEAEADDNFSTILDKVL